MGRRRIASALAALAAFASTLLLAAATLPYALGLLQGCFPPKGSCGDAVGWAMIISAPVIIPVFLIVAVALAALVYRVAMRAGTPN